MKPKVYEILSDCIDRGIDYGLWRARKHDDNPDAATEAEMIRHGIMQEIHQYFDFETAADRELAADGE